MTERKKRILVIAPHADDEVLGCGGYLLHQKGAEIKLLIGTIGGVDKRQDFATRLDEFAGVCSKLQANGKYLFKEMDAMLDTVPSREIVSALDKEIDTFRPTEIFVNYRSAHQDHIKIYECAMASLRMREGYRPNFVALYEYPIILDCGVGIGGGTAYHDITDVIDAKVGLFEVYASQWRVQPSPLNANGIMSLASIRGLECGYKYAEKFYIQKMML